MAKFEKRANLTKAEQSEILRDAEISLEAKGMLLQLNEFVAEGMKQEIPDEILSDYNNASKYQIHKTIKELVAVGYLKNRQEKEEGSGKFSEMVIEIVNVEARKSCKNQKR